MHVHNPCRGHYSFLMRNLPACNACITSQISLKHIIDLTVQQNKPKKKCADQFWIRDLNLHISDKQVLLNPVGRLTDDIVNAAQALLKKQFPDIRTGHEFLYTDRRFLADSIHTNNHW